MSMPGMPMGGILGAPPPAPGSLPHNNPPTMVFQQQGQTKARRRDSRSPSSDAGERFRARDRARHERLDRDFYERRGGGSDYGRRGGGYHDRGRDYDDRRYGRRSNSRGRDGYGGGGYRGRDDRRGGRYGRDASRSPSRGYDRRRGCVLLTSPPAPHTCCIRTHVTNSMQRMPSRPSPSPPL